MSSADPYIVGSLYTRPPGMPSEAGYPAFLLQMIHDLQEPCICTGLGGHTNPDCVLYDLPKRAGLICKREADARRIRVRAALNAVTT